MADVVWRPDAPEYLDDAIDYIRQFDPRPQIRSVRS